MENKERDLFSIKNKKTNTQKRKRSIDSNPKKAKIKKKNNTTKDVSSYLPPFEVLTYQNIVEGQIIFGCISEVRDYELVVSLPHRLVGYVPISNISKAYTKLLSQVADGEEVNETVYTLEDLYCPGQFVTVQVKKLVNVDNKTKVNLTLKPKKVNSEIKNQPLREGLLIQCACKSTEDNGYILETGLPSVHGAFLPKSEAPNKIGVGSNFFCRILSVSGNDGDLSVKLTAKPEFDGSTFSVSKSNSFSPFPGDCVYSTIKKVIPEGLFVEVNGCQGVVSSAHLLTPYDNQSNYQVGESFLGRVLFASFLSRVFHLSINEALLQDKIDGLPPFKQGDSIDKAVIYKSSNSSVHFELPDDSYGYCSNMNAKDGGISGTKMKAAFKVGMKKQCKILTYSYIDQTFIVSLRKSLLEEKVLGMQSLEIGQVHEVVIKEYVPAGAIVAVSQNIDGFVPNMHLTDFNMAKPQLKHPTGKRVKGRIIRMISGKSIHFTLKSALIDSVVPIKEVASSLVGRSVEGCIAKINAKGILVEFFNGIKGFISKKYVQLDDTLENLNKVFSIGQVCKCSVLKVFDDDGILLSMIDFDTHKQNLKEIENTEREEVSQSLKISKKDNLRNSIGKFLDCVIISINKEEEVIYVQNQGLARMIKMPMFHLSDSSVLSFNLFKYLREGDKIEKVLIFKSTRDHVSGTIKPSFCQYISEKLKLSKSIKKIHKGDVFPCIIEEILNDKLIVCAPTGFTYSLYKHNIASLPASIEISQLGLQKGQTLFVKCLRISQSSKLVISSKLKDVLSCSSMFQYLLNFLLLSKSIRETFSGRYKNFDKLSEFLIGEYVEINVTKVLNGGALGFVKDTDVKAVICGNLKRKTGKSKSEVAHVNYEENYIECSKLENSLTTKQASLSTSLAVGYIGFASILLIKPDFIVAKLLDGDQIIYLPCRRHPNDFYTMSKCFAVHQSCKIVVKHIEGDLILADIWDSKTYSKEPLKLASLVSSFICCNEIKKSAEEVQETNTNSKQFPQILLDSLAKRPFKYHDVMKRFNLDQFKIDHTKTSFSKFQNGQSLVLEKKNFWDVEDNMEGVEENKQLEFEEEEVSEQIEEPDRSFKIPEEIKENVDELTSYFKQGNLELARKTFDSALQELPKKLHLELIASYAKDEFMFGDPKKGSTVFDSLLQNFPQRLDISSLYSDILKHYNM